MKRFFTGIFTLALALSLTACGGQTTAPETTAPAVTPEPTTPAVTVEPTQSPETPAAELESPAAESTAPSTEEPEEGGKTLVAYFSWSGNTQILAELIQEETGADIFVISPETPYTEDYNELLDVAQEEQSTDARPALSATVENWSEYDTIFVGYPNWWGDAPMIIRSFLESYDCTGKTIVPFATSGGGGLGRGMTSITESAVGATVLDGFHVSGSQVGSASEDVSAWIDSLGL